MVSYWKTQRLKLVMALGALILTIINLVHDNDLMAVAWTVSFVYWTILSFVDYNTEKIKLLEAKAEKYDALVEKVDAIQELLETKKLVHVAEETRRGNKV